jgi:hypothetical protein
VKAGDNLDSFAIDPVEVVTLLLEAMKGKEVNATDSFGCSPLHYAAFRGATVSCLLLIQVPESLVCNIFICLNPFIEKAPRMI